MKKLFLDDIRNPKDCTYYMHSSLVPLYNTMDWIIVRTYNEFVKYITNNGMPDLISFDHDIEEDQIDGDIMDLKNCKIIYGKTGYDCAKWLVEYCMDHNIKLCEFIVHSANPEGARNIQSILDNYKKYEK